MYLSKTRDEWFGGRCSVTHCTRIVILQKLAARIVLHADIMTPTEYMFREPKWLPFSERVGYHICILMFKSLKRQTLSF